MRRYFSRYTVFFCSLVIIIFCCSWGFYAHETATQLAVYKLPKPLCRFFYANIDTLVANSIRPDKRRSTDRNEGAKHFVDLEAYGDSAAYKMPRSWQAAIQQYSLDTIKKYGWLPYQVEMEYDSLINAFKNKNADSIIFYADDLAHYIEDANVPLHTSINYDGQLTNQKGLHALWESAIPELELSHYNLYKKHKARYIKDKKWAIWGAIQRAHTLLPEMIAKEKEVAKNFPDSSKYEERMYYGRKTKVYTHAFARQYAVALGATINNQLLHSADMVADFWYSAWVDAGKPNLDGLYILDKTGKKQLRKEMCYNRKNKLLQNSRLRSNKE